jgi:hypothetical protein
MSNSRWNSPMFGCEHRDTYMRLNMTTTSKTLSYLAEIIGHGFEATTLREFKDDGSVESSEEVTHLFLRVRLLWSLDDEQRAHICPAAQRTIRHFLWDPPESRGDLERCLQALGFKFEDFSLFDPSEFNAISLVGRRIEVRIDHEEHLSVAGSGAKVTVLA